MFDLITIGDCGIDTFLELDPKEVKVVCTLHKEACELCLNYADKIPVESVHETIGGNAANAAVGSRRLGLKTAIYTNIGKDKPGQRIVSHLKEEGVSTALLRKNGRTNRSTAISIEGERTLLVFHEKRNYRLPKLPETKWVYFTSMAPGSEKIYPEIAKIIKERLVKMVFNPGTFQLRLGKEKSKPILENSEIFIANKEEIQEFTGNNSQDDKSLLKSVCRLGSKMAVLTDGENGSCATDGTNLYHLDILPAKRVESTGAGDAYATGLVSALILGKALEEAMAWGTINSAKVIEKIGPQEGLLKKDQMEQIIKDNPKFRGRRLQ